MAWDKNKPAGSQKIRLSDDEIRANNEALEAAFSEGHDFATGGTQTGKHVHPTFVDTGVDATAPSGTNELRLYNRGGMLQTVNQAGVRSSVSGIPSGTKMLFKQNTAPSGWTFLAEDHDRVLLNTQNIGEGGSLGGSWTIPLTVAPRALNFLELPSFSFSIATLGATDGTNNYPIVAEDSDPYGIVSITTQYVTNGQLQLYPQTSPYFNKTTISIGGGASHDHGISQGSWRPLYAKVITCQKD